METVEECRKKGCPRALKHENLKHEIRQDTLVKLHRNAKKKFDPSGLKETFLNS